MRHGQSDRTLLVAAGAVRSGKSYSVMLSFAAWLMAQDERRDHVLLGQSVEAAMRNVGFDLLDVLKKLGGQPAIDKRYGTRILMLSASGHEQSIWVIGAADERARRRIQGSTLKGLVIEEMTLVPREVWDYSWSRLSVTGAKCWSSLNPEGPAHWVKRQVVDRIEDFDGELIEFKMRDNPSLDDETIARYESSLTGHMYKRLIEGLWSAASGACFPQWSHGDVPDDWRSRATWTAALDWAVSGTLAMLAVCMRGDGRFAVVRHELVRTGRDDGLLVEQDMAELCVSWWRATIGEPTGVQVIGDPATPETFKRLLRQHGMRWLDGENDVIPGIVTTAHRLASGEILVHEDCKTLVEELAGYVWDEKKAEIGEDAPVKQADHCVDAVRYFAHTKMPWTRTLTKPFRAPIRLNQAVERGEDVLPFHRKRRQTAPHRARVRI